MTSTLIIDSGNDRGRYIKMSADGCMRYVICSMLTWLITVILIYHVCILLNPASETAPSLLSEHISPVPCTECWISWDDVRGDCCPATQDSGRDGETSSLSQKVKCLFSYHRDDFWVIFCLFILVKILQCQDFSIFVILTLPTALYL